MILKNSIKNFIYLKTSQIKTILMKVYIDTLETKQYFFETKDEDGKIVSLYRDENRYICAEINGEIYKSKIKLSNKKWHTVGLTFLYKFNTGASIDGSIKSSL